MQLPKINKESLNSKIGNFLKFFLDNSFWLIVLIIIFVVLVEGFYFYSINNKIKQSQNEITVGNILLNKQEFEKFKEYRKNRSDNFSKDVTISLINPFFTILPKSVEQGQDNSSSSSGIIKKD